MNKSEIINYVMHTPENSNPWVLGDMLDEYDSENQGDYSYATITFTNLSSEKNLVIDSGIIEKRPYGLEGWPAYEVLPNTSNTIQILLYKGADRAVFVTAEENPIITGNIKILKTQKWSQTYEHNCEITGDCTFTGTGIKPTFQLDQGSNLDWDPYQEVS